LPRLDPRDPQLDPKRDEQYPPGQFVSDKHEADCSRFLEDVRAFIHRRSELGLRRER
jgi:hypothetical protein